jgi:hypothetical protein
MTQQWDSLAEAFRDDGSQIDAQALGTAVIRRRRRQWLGLAGELVASALLLVFWVPQIGRGSLLTDLLGVGSVAFVVLWLGVLWHTRRETCRRVDVDVDSGLAFLRRERQAEVRWTVVVDRFLLALAIVYPPVLPLAWREAGMADAAASTGALWLLAAVGGYYVILAGIWVMNRRHRQRLLQDDSWT